MNKFDIYEIISDVYNNTNGKIFIDEYEFQNEFIKVLQNKYRKDNVVILRESVPLVTDDDNKFMHIDIVVILDNKLIPIELKYRLKKQAGMQQTRYNYYKDIKRIEKIKDSFEYKYSFDKGYAIILTDNENLLLYKQSDDIDSNYNFQLKNMHRVNKCTALKWNNMCENTKDKYQKFKLDYNYEFVWYIYDKNKLLYENDRYKDRLYYLVTEIKGK